MRKHKVHIGLIGLISLICLVGINNNVAAQEHSAMTALRWSLLPGGGQIYNHQAWKVPIVYGAFAGMGYFVNYNYQKMAMFKEEYLYRRTHNDERQLQEYASYPTENIYSLYNSYNRDFQLMVIITVGIYALNLVDAYVFGHLYDFKIDDELSFSVSPTAVWAVDGWHPAVGVGLRF